MASVALLVVDAAAPTLRRGLLWLAGLTTIAIVVERAVERHLTNPTEWIAWAAMAGIVIAVALLVRASSARRLHLARLLAAVVMLSSAYGVWNHVYANYDVAPLDGRYQDTGDTLPDPIRWWLAVSKTVGPSPPLAPLALAQASLCVLLASYRHPLLVEVRAD